jgi:drug/metabolite transporter (DMT)-like permease
MQSMLLEGNEKLPSLSLLAHMAPISAIILIPLTIVQEPESLDAVGQLSQGSNVFNWLLMVNCILAFFVNLTNFLVTKYCGALTLQVLGNAKGVAAAAISILIFHNPVTILGWVGYSITMFGVIAYSESRKRSGKGKEPAVGPLLLFTTPVHAKT